MKVQDVSIGAWSGGGVRVNLLIQSAIEMRNKGYKFDVLCGNSSGLLTALAYAFNILDEVADFLKTSQAFGWVKSSPINKDGGLSCMALGRAVTGRSYLGVQDELELIEQFITPSMWAWYRCDKRPPIYTTVVDIANEQEVLINLKTLSWKRAKQYIAASCRVYVMTEPIYIQGVAYCDGGIASHCPAHVLIDHLQEEGHTIGALTSIYTEHIYQKGKVPKWILPATTKLISMLQGFNSRDDAKMERIYSLAFNFKYTYLRLYDDFKHPYDIDPQRAKTSLAKTIEKCKEL